MKKVLLLSLFLTGIFTVNSAQSASCDPTDTRLSAKFNASEIKKMPESDVCKHIYILDNGYFIADVPNEKANSIKFDGTKNLTDLRQINIYELNIEIKEDRYQYFKVSGTNKMLAIKPMFLINTERLKK